MGSGLYGGFGKTKGSEKTVFLPDNASQLKHIFGERSGHLPDTLANRERLLELANDSSKFRGTDKWGNSWNVEINDDGTQDWVRYRDGIINNGGRNITPLEWDIDTGLNNNPFK